MLSVEDIERKDKIFVFKDLSLVREFLDKYNIVV